MKPHSYFERGQQVEVLLSRAIDYLQRLLSQHGKLILAQRMTVQLLLLLVGKMLVVPVIII